MHRGIWLKCKGCCATLKGTCCVDMSVNMPVCVCSWEGVCVCSCMHICMCAWVNACMSIYVYVLLCALCVCICACVHMVLYGLPLRCHLFWRFSASVRPSPQYLMAEALVRSILWYTVVYCGRGIYMIVNFYNLWNIVFQKTIIIKWSQNKILHP